jgi:hypothetical protein
MCYIAVINKGDVKDTEMDALMDGLVDGLFSFCVTHGTKIKLFRFPRLVDAVF